MATKALPGRAPAPAPGGRHGLVPALRLRPPRSAATAGSRALRLRASLPSPGPSAPTLTHNRSRRDLLAPPPVSGPQMPASLWCWPGRLCRGRARLYTWTSTVTPAILTRVRAHSADTTSGTRPHPHSPAGTTWDNVKGWSLPRANARAIFNSLLGWTKTVASRVSGTTCRKNVGC